MKRFHVHIAVDDLIDSIRFYTALFAAEPSVVKPDYAKWMLDDPRVNFAVSARGAAPGLNHLGMQVESSDELAEMRARLQTLQAEVIEESGAACCYAKSDKYWASDPQGIPWETFRTLDSIPVFGADAASAAACCVPLAPANENETSPCCIPSSPGKVAAGGCC
jgi:hypothetical protein